MGNLFSNDDTNDKTSITKIWKIKPEQQKKMTFFINVCAKILPMIFLFVIALKFVCLSVCLFVRMSDHKLADLPQILLGNRLNHANILRLV